MNMITLPLLILFVQTVVVTMILTWTIEHLSFLCTLINNLLITLIAIGSHYFLNINAFYKLKSRLL